WVDVVEATRMDLSCARAGAAATSVMVAAKTTRLRRVGMMFPSSCACHDTDDGQTSSSPVVSGWHWTKEGHLEWCPSAFMRGHIANSGLPNASFNTYAQVFLTL